MTEQTETWVMVIYRETDAIALMQRALDPERRGDPSVYLCDYDPDGHDGFGAVVMTDDVARARHFPSFEAVMETWRQPSTTRPLRDDGKRDRQRQRWLEMVDRLTAKYVEKAPS